MYKLRCTFYRILLETLTKFLLNDDLCILTFGIKGVGDGQGGLACCNSWGRKELDTTERLN